MRSLTILYDGACALCVRCRDFLAQSSTFVPLELLSSQSRGARERFGDVPWLGEELVVVSDEGDVWVGPAAFLVCLWALREWREWSYRLSGETFTHGSPVGMSDASVALARLPAEPGGEPFAPSGERVKKSFGHWRE